LPTLGKPTIPHFIFFQSSFTQALRCIRLYQFALRYAAFSLHILRLVFA